MKSALAIYRFQTLDQSITYRMNADEVSYTFRKGLTRTAQTIPLEVIDGPQTSWETSNNTRLVLVLVCVIGFCFGIWGLVDPKSTGMYTTVALGLIGVGITLPTVLRQHRRLTGVTFFGDSNYSLSVISHAKPSSEYHKFVEVLKEQIKQKTEAFSTHKNRET